MNEYFTNEIKRVSREVINLKTSGQKSAGNVPIVSQSVNVSVPLSLNSARTSCSGVVSYRVSSDKEALIIPTLDWYYGNILENDHFPYTTRHANVVPGVEANGDYLLRVTARGTTEDTQALINGSSVSVSVVLRVQSTDNFNIEAI